MCAGKDATEGFYGRNHSDSAKKWLKDFEIGSLGDTSKKWSVYLLSVCVYSMLARVVLITAMMYKEF